MSHNMSIIALVTRAESISKRTGRPTCLICRHMRTRKVGVASCRENDHEIVIVDGMINCLSSMTVRASSCEKFDDMTERAS